jgi:hypothetical protein
LKHLNKARTAKAEDNLSESVGRHSLVGKTFLDIGSGSGLLSFSARRLGIVVTSFDFDTVSAACNEEFRGRFFRGDPFWTVGLGLILDKQYIDALGQFDIVCSWGFFTTPARCSARDKMPRSRPFMRTQASRYRQLQIGLDRNSGSCKRIA